MVRKRIFFPYVCLLNCIRFGRFNVAVLRTFLIRLFLNHHFFCECPFFCWCMPVWCGCTKTTIKTKKIYINILSLLVHIYTYMLLSVAIHKHTHTHSHPQYLLVYLMSTQMKRAAVALPSCCCRCRRCFFLVSVFHAVAF